MTRTTAFPLPTLLAVLWLAGCRTYGGYGSEDQLAAQIQQSHTQFTQMLDQARNDFIVLQQQAAANPALAPQVAAFEATLQAHEALVRDHEVGRHPAAGASYRDLSNAFGAMLSEHQQIADRYQAVLQQARGGQAVAVDQSRYQVVPPYYVRVLQAQSAATGSAAPPPDTTAAPVDTAQVN
jgi:hypothetical protein